ncbi:MAG: patatin-like phospholipase family protein [Bacteroidota bacterium]
MSETKFGIVLSGGGIRGLAHIGVIKVLEEEGIYPQYIAGTSAGAIVGALYAAGYGAEDVLKFFKETSLFSVNKYAYGKPGMLDTDKYYQAFLPYFPEDSFDALDKKLYVTATDILVGKTRFFHEGPLIKSILASAAFPIVLSPVSIGETIYADGGITNNFPVEPLLIHCDKVIGVYANPLKVIKAEELSSAQKVMSRAFKIGSANMSIQKFSLCDLVIAPQKLNEFNTFSMNHLEDAFEIGYKKAKEHLDDIRRLKET